jgi:hypothetical protein
MYGDKFQAVFLWSNLGKARVTRVEDINSRCFGSRGFGYMAERKARRIFALLRHKTKGRFNKIRG